MEIWDRIARRFGRSTAENQISEVLRQHIVGEAQLFASQGTPWFTLFVMEESLVELTGPVSEDRVRANLDSLVRDSVLMERTGGINVLNLPLRSLPSGRGENYYRFWPESITPQD